jgi:outer membrane receptor protein involved in Fe transport
MNRKTQFSLQFASALGIGVLSTTAYSQPILEEVLVTASKRVQGMQDVPIALSVMNSEKIADQGIGDLEEMAVFMPNVHIAEGGAGDQLFIRGVGSGINYGFEQSVGTFIDGVYFGRGQASRSTFLDIARVEILKGPQSTLFGKNTVAGAISITTARPGDEFEGMVEATAEPEFDGWGATLVLSGPLTDTLGARFAVKRDETDGYMNNTFKGRDERQEENTVARIVLDWAATDMFDVSFKYEKGETETLGRQDLITVATPFAIDRYREADPEFTASFGYDKSSQNIAGVISDDQYHDSEWDIATLTAELAVGDFTLKSITGYVDYQFDNYLDSDYGPLQFIARGRDEAHEQFTQEFLLSSPVGETIEYLAGVYYQDESLEHESVTDVLLSNAGIGGGSFDATGNSTFNQDSTTLSGFVQGTFNVTDTFRAIVGIRYSQDEKEFDKIGRIAQPFSTIPDNALAGIYDAVLNFSTDHEFRDGFATRCTGIGYDCVTVPFDTDRTKSNTTGDITLQWNATDDIMAYFKVGNGYKAFGFDQGNSRGLVDPQAFEQEEVISYELGSKMDLLGGRARLNMALFYSEFEDLQVSAFDGNAGFVVGNAGESEVYGFEVDGSMAVTEELSVNASLAYLDASYTSFPNAACNESQVLEWIAGGGARGSCTQDLAGEPLQFSPEFAGSLALEYFTTISDSLNLRLTTDINYSDDYHVANDLDPVLEQGSFTKLNARVELSSANDTWSIAVLGKNLTDEKTSTWGNDVPLAGQGFSQTYFQHIDPPRSFEVQARYRF